MLEINNDKQFLLLPVVANEMNTSLMRSDDSYTKEIIMRRGTSTLPVSNMMKMNGCEDSYISEGDNETSMMNIIDDDYPLLLFELNDDSFDKNCKIPPNIHIHHHNKIIDNDNKIDASSCYNDENVCDDTDDDNDESLLMLRAAETMYEDTRETEKIIKPSFPFVGDRRETISDGNNFDYHYDSFYGYYNRAQGYDIDKPLPSDACTKTTFTETTASDGDALRLLTLATEKDDSDDMMYHELSPSDCSLSSGFITESVGLNSYHHNEVYRDKYDSDPLALHIMAGEMSGNTDEIIHNSSFSLRNNSFQTESVGLNSYHNDNYISNDGKSEDEYYDNIHTEEKQKDEKQEGEICNFEFEEIRTSVKAAFKETDAILSNALASFHEDILQFSMSVISMQ